jgi:glycolate oxidase
MDIGIIGRLKEICGDDFVVSDLSKIGNYLYDETEEYLKPEACTDVVVAKPKDSKEISEIVKYANEILMPVIPRGGGTGLNGAVIPDRPGIILSMERLSKNIEVDDKNLMVIADSGVTLAQLNEELKKSKGLFFPIHPGDEGAQLGGMVAENAGGVSAVKHGIMRNHVKGLEVVLPTGEIVMLGGKLIKNNTGYDLLHMMVGSEGTLGIITKVILKLYAKQNHTGTLLVSFDSRQDASDTVPAILQSGITPLAIEYVEKNVIEEAARHMGLVWPAKEGIVDLMIILEEGTEDDLFAKSEAIVEIAEKFNAVDSIIAETAKDQRNILQIRSNVYTAFIEHAIDGMDISVPPASVPYFVRDLDEIAAKYNTTLPCVGHIGDGNIHNFVMKENGEKPSWFEDIRLDIYKAAMKYGGAITAEHGTGKTRKLYMPLQYTNREIEIMKGVKRAFDPNGILNPGTIVDL